MKKFILIISVLILISVPVVDAIPLSDKTGLKFTFPVKTDGKSFVIEATGNLDIADLDFDKNKKSITLEIVSSLENNILEIVIPKNLIGGDYSFFIDGTEVFPKLSQGKNSLFSTIEFSGIGNHKLIIQGTTYLDIFVISEKIDYEISHGIVKTIESNPSTNSMSFLLSNIEEDGKLSVKLSDDVLSPFENGTFHVIIDTVDSNYSIENDILIINFTTDSKKITIIGAYVVPEFYEIAPLILATSLIGLVVLRKHKKLFA